MIVMCLELSETETSRGLGVRRNESVVAHWENLGHVVTE